MRLNLLLFFGGLLFMMIGLYRIAPINFSDRKQFWGVTLQAAPLFLVLMLVVGLTYRAGGTAALEKGFLASFRVTGSFFPVIALLFPVMAISGVLAGFYTQEINQVLSGKFGYPGTLGAAFLVPTSQAAAEPIKFCWQTEVFRPLLLYFLTASALVCWPIFFFRVLGLTMEIGWQMYKTNWIVAIAIAPFFWIWSRAVEHGGLYKAILSLLP